jgi:hypothetical protein
MSREVETAIRQNLNLKEMSSGNIIKRLVNQVRIATKEGYKDIFIEDIEKEAERKICGEQLKSKADLSRLRTAILTARASVGARDGQQSEYGYKN